MEKRTHLMRLNSALKTEPRLVGVLPEGGRTVTLGCIQPKSREWFVISKGVPADKVNELLRVSSEAVALMARRLDGRMQFSVPQGLAWYRGDGQPRERKPHIRVTMRLVDPAEIVLDHPYNGGRRIKWSDGLFEDCERLTGWGETPIEASKLLGVLYVLQHVGAFAGRDGDHAIGTRVVRFLMAPHWLLRV